MSKLQLRVEPRDGAPYTYECERPSVVIGRSRQADLVLGDRFVSRLHARLQREGDDWYLEDLGSHNLWSLNGRPVQGRTLLASGDVLELGSTRIVYQPEAPASAGAGADDQGATLLRPAAELVSALEAPVSDKEAGARDRGTERLRLLNEVHRALAGPIELEALLELVLERAFEQLRPDEGVVLLKEPGGVLRRAAQRRLPGVSGEFLESRRLIREVTENAQAALVVDVRSDERFARAESIVGLGVRSLLAAPLLSPDGCLGMIALSSRAALRPFSEDDLALLACLASAAALRIRNLALAEEAAQRRVLEKELSLAREIQMAMLPKRLPASSELEVCAALEPARSVGGDLYDFFPEGERLWFLIGDVSGKGVGAALFMAVTKALFRAAAPSGPPDAVLSRVNRELSRDNERAMFVTVFLGCLDTRTGEVSFANAGHNPPCRLNHDGTVETVRSAHGLALGVVGGFAYETARLTLAPGDALCLYTDGVTEALNEVGEQFGVGRFHELLRDAAREPAARLVERVMGAVRSFAGLAPQSDDIAFLALRYLREP